MKKRKTLFTILIIISSSLFFSISSKELLELKADPMGVMLEWVFLTGGEVKSSPAVADLDLDGTMEIIVGSNDNKVYCLNSTGGLKWSFQTWEDRLKHSSPCIADIDGDNEFEVLIGTYNVSTDYGALYCINADGTLEWMNTGYRVYSTPAVADLDDDGTLEILVGRSGEISGGWLQCIDHTGIEEWNYNLGTTTFSSPCIADLDNDNKLEILIGHDSDNDPIMYFDNNGTMVSTIWWGPISRVRSSPSVADLDNDGTLEVLFNAYETANGAGGMWYVNHLGEKEGIYIDDHWEVNLSSPVIADIDGDSSLEIVTGGTDAYATSHILACYDTLGNKEWGFTEQTGLEIEATPCVADLNNSGKLEVLFGSMNGSF